LHQAKQQRISEENGQPTMKFRPRMFVATSAWALLAMVCDTVASNAANQAATDQEAAYTQVINERAAKIVAVLDIDDDAKAARVRDVIAGQFRGLREIHDARDARIEEATKSPAGDRTVAEAWIKVARDQSAVKVIDLHRQFVARLLAELSPEQVEKVKDGMTYGIVQVTYSRYLELLPELNDEQKREIMANLLEAREHAMDGGSSEEKHAIFGQYKGRINNYLSKQGFDLKAAEKELSARQRAAERGR
jgi:hypothetical protein